MVKKKRCTNQNRVLQGLKIEKLALIFFFYWASKTWPHGLLIFGLQMLNGFIEIATKTFLFYFKSPSSPQQQQSIEKLMLFAKNTSEDL